MLHNYEPFEGWKTEENCASKERLPLLPIPLILYQISFLANAKDQIFYVQTIFKHFVTTFHFFKELFSLFENGMGNLDSNAL